MYFFQRPQLKFLWNFSHNILKSPLSDPLFVANWLLIKSLSLSHVLASELQLGVATAGLQSCGFLHILKYSLVDGILLQMVMAQSGVFEGGLKWVFYSPSFDDNCACLGFFNLICSTSFWPKWHISLQTTLFLSIRNNPAYLLLSSSNIFSGHLDH